MRVAITGGTGSLGSTIIAKLVRDGGADRIVTFSRDEQKRLALQAQYRDHPGVKVYAGDVRDERRLTDIFHGCDAVIHAAARKVVSGHHDEPREMHQTNVLGTLNVVQAARDAGVRKLLFVSSDKAVHAENVYGVSKALAEHLVISENARSYSQGLRMSVIRYGNVLGSNGSVLRLWRQCMDRGERLPITSIEMTRFWLTLEQAAGFVLQALGNLRGGEVFLPCIKAAPLTALAGALADGLEFMETGIRTGGEKLHEELLSADEARRTVERHGFYVVTPAQSSESWDMARWEGTPVRPGFTYRSDTWPLVWSADNLRMLIGGPHAVAAA